MERETLSRGQPSRRARAWTLLRAIVHEMRVERITFLAGSVAYHAFVSTLPLLLLLLAVVGAVGDAGLEAAFIAVTRSIVTAEASDVLVSELRRASASTGLSVLGLGVLVWGTLRVFRGLDTAFSAVYETGGRNDFADKLRDGIVVMVAFALAILAAVTVEAAVPWGDVPASWALQRVSLIAGLALVLYPMYYVFPDAGVGRLEVVPGTVLAAVGLTAAESLFGLYVAYSSRAPEQSVVAAVLVFLSWLYVSGLLILVGAVVNAVLSNRSADVSVDPVIGGVPRENATAPDRETVLAAVDELVGALDDADSVTVTVDGQEVAVPPPNSVRVTDRGEWLLGTGSVRVDVAWSPREE
jgi:membrane protein